MWTSDAVCVCAGQACDLASQATQAASYKDWWWKAALGKCYYRLGMFREAEKQFKSALKQQVSSPRIVLTSAGITSRYTPHLGGHGLVRYVGGCCLVASRPCSNSKA